MSEQWSFSTRTGHSSPDSIEVYGFNLSEELIGELNLGEMFYLVVKEEKPSQNEARLLNAILISLVEHGLTPSAVSTRLTYLGEPESLQGAVASGLLGVGSQFVGTTENTAKILQRTIQDQDDNSTTSDLASEIVEDFRNRGESIPGLGHPLHEPEDPRTVKLLDLAAKLDQTGKHTALLKEVRDHLSKKIDRTLPINVTGTIGALLSDMGFSWRIIRGCSIVSRCVGLIGHLKEEQENPMAMDLWDFLEEGSERP